jgi:hypothetical protein
MRVALGLPVIVAAMLLSATDAGAQVYRGNDTGGIISWSCENEAIARETADAFCASYNKYGRITSVHRMYGDYIAFNCLWRPDIARYQLPLVRTRAACLVAARTHPHVSVRY